MNDPYPWSDSSADATLLIVGDVNLQNRADPASAFKNVRATLAAADLRYCNLEGCLYRPAEGDIPKKNLWKHSDERMVEGLAAVAFQAVGCANNVTYGTEAMANTMRVLDERGIVRCGIGANKAEAWKPAIVTVKGIRFGFLQFTARHYGPEQFATETQLGVAAFDADDPAAIDQIAAAVAALRPQVDVLAFSHHLRKTGTTEVEDYQRLLARKAIDAGADVVFGHGAHLNQEIELYSGVPIFHCIGQFAFDWAKTKPKKDGLLLRIEISGRKIARFAFIPVSRDENNDVYLLAPDSEEGKRQLDGIAALSRPGVFHVRGAEAEIRVIR